MKQMKKYGFVITLVVLIWSMAVTGAEYRNIEKLSISTQMLLDELAEQAIDDDASVPGPVRSPSASPVESLLPSWRHLASPEVIDGVTVIPAFVRVASDEDIALLRDMGVIVETVFEQGLLTTLIPVERILDVAALDGVRRIEVSEVMQPATDLARVTTRVSDVIGYTPEAIAMNLPKGYDGSGVIVAVIDRGIDFDHIAFKDKNGQPRIKRAYVYNGSSTVNYYGEGPLPNDGITNTDHGSHTSAIAGGSSVIVNGNEVTVTDDHTAATYGGMAPGADLFLCGINGMASSRIANAFSRICSYADSVGMPVVVSNSYGDNVYNRDGGGVQSEIISQLFGESHPDRICVFAAGNNAGHSGDEPGGIYVSGHADSESPLGTVISSSSAVINAGWRYYKGEYIADAFTRADDAAGVGVIVYVLDAVTGEVVDSYAYQTSNGNQTVILGDYFTGVKSNVESGENAQLRIYFDYRTARNKKQVILYTPYGLISQNYTLAVEVYPIGGSSDVIDMWSTGTYTYFDNHLTTAGHTWTLGSDDMSVFANACYPEVISVGSYVSRATQESNDVGDISDFSSYAVEGTGPMGCIYPWITAPGEEIISAFNHNVVRSYYDDIIVNDPSNLYGLMSGTSMATPMVAGVVALWMQAATECGKSLTLSEVKTIMKETAIKDSWVTDGPHASHFGNGKINALAGVGYILNAYGGHDYQVGDVDHNGFVDVADVTALIAYVLGVDNGICEICANVDGYDDGASVSDVTRLIGIILSNY